MAENSVALEAGSTGLTQAEAKRRLAQFGPNEPAPTRRTAPLFQLLSLLANPLAIMLLVASGISAGLGEVINASIIITMVLFSVALNFIQTYRSQKAVDSIRKEVAPTATALRDSQWIEIPRREIVPGDVIKLAAGDLVPADACVDWHKGEGGIPSRIARPRCILATNDHNFVSH